MKIDNIISRQLPPAPWAEGDNIPWNEPGFSRRMLREHLSQDHDAASRRMDKIDRHVEWIDTEILKGKKSRILDIGCGPGFYLQRLAKMGHECAGIDYSPASIDYAKSEAAKDGLDINYIPGDMRTAVFGSEFDLVMNIFGEINVFTRSDAGIILKKVAGAIAEGGNVLFEVQKYESLEKRGQLPPSWHSAPSGLFSDRPYICLQENFWDTDRHATTLRFFVMDSGDDKIDTFSVSYQAYTMDQYRELFSECGFEDLVDFPSLTGTPDDCGKDMMVLMAKKGLAPHGLMT